MSTTAEDRSEGQVLCSSFGTPHGLDDKEITRTLTSARRTHQPHTDHQAEAGEGR